VPRPARTRSRHARTRARAGTSPAPVSSGRPRPRYSTAPSCNRASGRRRSRCHRAPATARERRRGMPEMPLEHYHPAHLDHQHKTLIIYDSMTPRGLHPRGEEPKPDRDDQPADEHEPGSESRYSGRGGRRPTLTRAVLLPDRPSPARFCSNTSLRPSLPARRLARCRVVIDHRAQVEGATQDQVTPGACADKHVQPLVGRRERRQQQDQVDTVAASALQTLA